MRSFVKEDFIINQSFLHLDAELLHHRLDDIAQKYMLRAGTKIQSRFVNFSICNCGDEVGHALIFRDVISERLVEAFRVSELLVNAPRVTDRLRQLLLLMVAIVHDHAIVIDTVLHTTHIIVYVPVHVLMIHSWVFHETTHTGRLSRLTSVVIVVHSIRKVLRLPLLKRKPAEGVLHGRRRLLLRRRVHILH